MSKPGDIAETLLMLTRERDEARTLARRLANTGLRLTEGLDSPQRFADLCSVLHDFYALPWAKDTSS